MGTKDNNKSKFFGSLPGIIFILLLIIGLALYDRKRDRLKEDYKFTYGIITGYKDAGWRSAGGTFFFEFKVDDTLIREQVGEPGIRSRYSHIFIGKTFPVVYLPDDLGNNDMLITPKSFELMDTPFPDSLNWVVQYQ